MTSSTLRASRTLGPPCREVTQVLRGFAIGHTEQWFTGKHFLLQEMCVRTDLQRQGAGTALLGALEARLAGVEQVYLLTERHGAAHRFYEHCGFRAAQRTGVMTKRIS
ncbi:GNAT family N-acetyltransferase [Actinopolymorpha sp. NPDC004070]|uniref:GNAT family N-acetyltransferase n=1 Tax=Actinopolymorpha sp. NPDC004070 TaxID=3154548 RepID=UPI0033AF854F